MVETSGQLSTLPVDALQQVVGYLSAFTVSHLWLCGDKRLQAKLRAYDVVTWFDYRPRDLSLPIWPTLISVFPHITFFRLELLEDNNSTLTSDNILQLPSTVRELVLQGQFPCYSAFRDAMALLPAKFPVLETLILHEHEQLRAEGTRRRVHWPSSLKSLGLLVNDDLDLCELPSGLERLSACVIEVLHPLYGFSRTLEHLILKIDGDLLLPIESLPSGLKTLKLMHSPNHYDDWDLSKLPPGLISLDVPIFYTKEELLSLPPMLEHLDTRMPRDVESLVEFLPRTLKTAGKLIPFVVKKEVAQKLPLGLESLSHGANFNALPYLPTGIRTATVYGIPSDLSVEMGHLMTMTTTTTTTTTIPTRLEKVRLNCPLTQMDDSFPFHLMPSSLAQP